MGQNSFYSLLHKLCLFGALFLAGASVLVVEIQGARLLSPWWGSTVYVWSSLITVAMAALSLGYVIGGRLVDRRPEYTLIYSVLIVAGGATALSLILLRLSGESLLPLGIVWGPLVTVAFLFSLPLLCMAMVTPIALRLHADAIATLGSTAGRLYALATAGSLVGSLLSGFVFSAHFSASSVFIGVALVLIGWGTLGLVAVRRSGAVSNSVSWVSVAMIVLSVSVVLGAWYAETPRTSGERSDATPETTDAALEFLPPEEAKQKVELAEPTQVSRNGMPQFSTLFSSRGTSEARVILHEPSFYGDVMVFDFADSIRCFMIDGANESCWNFDRNLPSEYTHDMAYTLMNSGREIKDVLVIGSGAGTFAKFVRSEVDDEIVIDGVEINPVMIEVAEKYFAMPEADHDRVALDDGRHFLMTTDKKYDAIILDICYVSSANVHLWTEEFFALAKAHLKDPDTGFIMASRGISNEPDSDQMDDMVANALSQHFDTIYSIERINRNLPNDFGMGVFVASNEPLELTETGGKLGSVAIRPWEFDMTAGIATDSGYGELLRFSAGATEGIRQQTITNFGPRLLEPL